MRNADYIPVAPLPIVDLGARYEAAKARREEAELRKLEYINQFQQTRGRISPGLLPEVSKYWDAIEESLDAGDMSFEAKKKRAELYRQYQNVAADAVSYNQELNEREATILSDPSKFNDPYSLVKSIEELRAKPIGAGSIVAELNALPSLGKSLRSRQKTITPGEISTELLANLKQGGGIENFYDPFTGARDDAKILTAVQDYMRFNQLSSEEEDAAIAGVYRKKYPLSNSDFEFTSKIQNLTKEERLLALSSVESDAANLLMRSLASDITTEQEKEKSSLGLLEKQLKVRAKFDKPDDGGASSAQPFKLFMGDVEIVQPKVISQKDGKEITKGTEKANAGLVINSPLTGTKPSFIDQSTNVKYTVQGTGVSKDGQPQFIVTYPVKTNINEPERLISRAYPVTERVISSLSDKKQAETIAVSLNRMMEVYNQTPEINAPQSLFGPQTSQQFNQPLPFQLDAQKARLRSTYYPEE